MSHAMKDATESIMAAGLFMIFLTAVHAQKIVYQEPPKEIAQLVDAPPTPSISLSPDGDWLMVMENHGLAPISEISQPEHRLAGLRLNPKTNGPSRGSYHTAMTLINLTIDRKVPISHLPANPRIRYIRWAPNSRTIAFTLIQDNGIELWVADVESGRAMKLLGPSLNAAFSGSPFVWEPDSRSLICKGVVENRGSEPILPQVPTGPLVQENISKIAPARTYQDLLKNPQDELLFEYYFTSQLLRVDIQGRVTPIMKPGLIINMDISPDGQYILVATIHRPFSYLVPASRFPYRVDVLDTQGRRIKTIADLPLAEEVPIQMDAVPRGPRSFGWRQDSPSTLYWVEAQDEGDPKKEAEIRDKVWMLLSPFDRDPQMICNLVLRFRNIFWSDDKFALIHESWWTTRKERVWLFEPGAQKKSPKLLFDYSREDRYNHPGTSMLVTNDNGAQVLRRGANRSVLYLRGEGASSQGDFPFIDEYDVTSGKKKRLWQCQSPYYELAVDLIGKGIEELLTRRESITEQPNYYLHDLKKNSIKQITQFPHPCPQLSKVTKELIRYDRKDGIKLTATLYLPPDYRQSQGPLPVLLWAYPQEFKSADAASQVTDSPYRFVRVSPLSPLFWLVRGYAILDDPAMPIVGEKNQEPNDTYVEQLVASAQAAVDELVRRGIGDPDRIAIGGHSYGAFMVANLLSHSKIFKAGIARSGAYNRTLTPFGFQAEERPLWQARDAYIKMSPFMCADSLNAPLLLIHGDADNNSGTYPMQSERYYNALKGLGKTARFVVLPCERHTYQARESILHMLWEMDQWLERWVKTQ